MTKLFLLVVLISLMVGQLSQAYNILYPKAKLWYMERVNTNKSGERDNGND